MGGNSGRKGESSFASSLDISPWSGFMPILEWIGRKAVASGNREGRDDRPRGLVPYDGIENRIIMIRGQRVLLDSDLAALYGVTTGRLNEQVRRNRERFPSDFLFRLSEEEVVALRSQCAISKKGRGGRRYAPFAFTEHGAIMAASILNSPRAIEASVWVVRAFVKFREALATHRILVKKLLALEAKVGGHDDELKAIVKALRHLMAPPEKKKKPIGFGVKEKKARYHAKSPARVKK